MRYPVIATIAAAALASAGCGGGSDPAPERPGRPELDQDYTAPFIGYWSGTATFTRAGATSTAQELQEITRIDYNRLAIRTLCPGVDAVVGLDGPTAFSIDEPITCPAVEEPCGTVTSTYRSGTGNLDTRSGVVLGFSFHGVADGCGRSDVIARAFSGRPKPMNFEPPVALASPAAGVTDPGVPIVFDASASSDPDGWALEFSWGIDAQPAGAAATLTGAGTATPTFVSTVPGAYRLWLVVTAPDGQNAWVWIPILVRPAAASQGYVYLEQGDDKDGPGLGWFYTMATSAIGVSATGGHLAVTVTGDERWAGDFAVGNGLTRLEPGLYEQLGRYSATEPVLGGLAWLRPWVGCDALTGWFAVDDVTYADGALTGIDVRFEQRCAGAAPVHGRIHWRAGDTTQPPGPVDPAPAELWRPPPGSMPTSGSYVYLESDPGDEAGWGGSYLYTQADALFDVAASGGRLDVEVVGDAVDWLDFDERWLGTFQAMSSVAQLEPGYYANLTRYPEHNPARGGLVWSGLGECPGSLTGWFAIDAVTFSGATLTGIDLRFEQHCWGAAPALRGAIHWDASDPTTIRPLNPPPDLWSAPAGSTPASGTYVYLESEPNDFIGLGKTYLYTQRDAVITVSTYEDLGRSYWRVDVGGEERWDGKFQPMITLSQLEPGYYPSAHTSAGIRGAVRWSGEGRICSQIAGWMIVDAIAYSGNSITALDLRFEQHCEGKPEALHGQIHWDASDPTRPPGPVTPPPPGLWGPPAGATPSSGSYVYLEQDPAADGTGGASYLYTRANAGLVLEAGDPHARVTANGDEQWWGELQAMSPLTKLEPGYYGNLSHGTTFVNPARGWLQWFGTRRSCETLDGWFVVDSVTYSGDAITALDLRFEQPCTDPTVPVLHGNVHWDASDTTQPPGPTSPPPPGLWEPAPGTTPATGNYVHLESDPGDFVGAGQTRTFTDTGGPFSVWGTGAEAHAAAGVAPSDDCFGDFVGMSSVARLEPGYYGGLRDYVGYNPARGGLGWRVLGRHCVGDVTGWFVIDGVSYSGSTLTGLDLRFEQHCWGQAPALHGQIHWVAAP